MSDEQILQLIKIRPNGVVHQLIANGLAELIDERDGYTLENLKLSKSAEEKLDIKPLFSEQWFTNLKKKWHPELRGDSRTIKATCREFIEKNNVDLTIVEAIVDYWLRTNEKPFCGKMENFFYTLDKNSEVISRAEQMLEIEEATLKIEDDFRFKQV